jgi:uncharacterized protein with PhoU and TrkA domain
MVDVKNQKKKTIDIYSYDALYDDDTTADEGIILDSDLEEVKKKLSKKVIENNKKGESNVAHTNVNSDIDSDDGVVNGAKFFEQILGRNCEASNVFKQLAEVEVGSTASTIAAIRKDGM